MSCEVSDVFFTNFAFIPRIKQKYATFPHMYLKKKLKKVISTEVPAIMLEVIEVTQRRLISQKFGSEKKVS